MKTPEMEEFLNKMSINMFGRKRTDNCCITCGSDKINPENFKDDLSRKEFEISRMCQNCQDGVFGE